MSKYCCGCGYELPETAGEETVQDAPVKSKRKMSLSQKIGLVVGVVLVANAPTLYHKTFPQKPAFDKVLLSMASELNKNLPMAIDSGTRLDNVVALPNKTVLYNYTLVNLERVNIDTLEAKKILEPQIVNSNKTNPDMKYFRDNDVIMKYSYKDKEGYYVCSIVVMPEQYK
jgi:hypothetical protein